MRADALDDLKRRLSLLDRIDGEPLWTEDGLVVVRPIRVRDPVVALAAFAEALPRTSAIGRHLVSRRVPVPVDAAVLASARHAVGLVERSPALRKAAVAARRVFARYGALDPPWIARKKAHLDGLERALAAPPPGTAWERSLALVRARHGGDAAAEVVRARDRLLGAAREERAAAVLALRRIPAALALPPGGEPEELRPVVEQLRAIAGAGGRQRRRKIAAILSKELGITVLPPRGSPRELADEVREICRSAKLPEALSRDAVEGFLLHFAVAFVPAGLDELGVAEVRLGIEHLGRAMTAVLFGSGLHVGPGDRELTVVEAVQLLRFAARRKEAAPKWVRESARLVAAGVPVEAIELADRHEILGQLAELAHEPEAAKTFVRFLDLFARVKETSGRKIPLTAALARSLHRTYKKDTGLLLACMLEDPPGGDLDAKIAHVDAVLGLFRSRPEEPRSLLARLRAIAPGAGRRAFPAASSPETDALLDELVHLSGIVGKVPALPKPVAKQVGRRTSRAEERAFLERARPRSATQEKRLRVLLREEGPPDFARVRAALEEHVAGMRTAAFDAELDRLLVRLAKKLFGVTILALTPPWRAVLRFALAVQKNQPLLRALVREASEQRGVLLAPGRPENQAWLAEARERFALAPWLDSTPREIPIEGATYTLRLEPDALEVLRMGVPFETCLSIEDGFNAASTVTNALDANKRVLYVRSPAGAIVGRKLLAVSAEWKLVGYHTYVSMSGAAGTAVTAAICAFCKYLGEATGLSLGASGTPRNLHGGFWYDDGVEPFDLPRTSVSLAAYAALLGLAPTEAPAPASLLDEARAVRALFAEDVTELVLRADDLPAPLARWGAEAARRSLGDAACLERARERSGFARLLLTPGHADARFACDVAARASEWSAFDAFERYVQSAPIADDVVFEIAAAGRRGLASKAFDDHGYEHRSLFWIPDLVHAVTPRRVFDLCDAVDPVWRWVEEKGSSCGSCREEAEARLVARGRRVFMTAPDADVLLACLRQGRRSHLARRLALSVLARHDAGASTSEIGRALRSAARDDDLAGTCAMWAASVRHRRAPLGLPPLPPDLGGIFEAAGPLLARADVAAIVAASPAARPRSGGWRPTRWEAFFHRRNETPLRAELRRRAEAGDADSVERLGELADAEGLRSVLARFGALPAAAKGKEPLRRSALIEKIELAERARRHVTALDDSVDPALPSVTGLGTSHIDAASVVRARSIVARRYAIGRDRSRGGPRSTRRLDDGSAAALAWAFDVILAACASTEWAPLVVRIAERSDLLDAELGFVTRALERSRLVLTQVPPLTIARLWQREILRRALADTLAECARELRFDVVYLTVARAAEAAGVDTGGLLEAWVLALADEKQTDSLDDITDPALQREVLRILARERLPAALEIHRWADALTASIFLDEAGPAGALDAPEAAAFVKAERKGRPFSASWLAGAIQAWKARP